jgi:hypothetical protein
VSVSEIQKSTVCTNSLLVEWMKKFCARICNENEFDPCFFQRLVLCLILAAVFSMVILLTMYQALRNVD